MFQSLYEGIKELIFTVLQYIGDFFFHPENGIVWWLLEFLLDIVEYILSFVPDISSILNDYSDEILYVILIIKSLDAFFPITESIILFSVFIAFVSTFIGIKYVLKLIPTIG
jgi:hypothetical protein